MLLICLIAKCSKGVQIRGLGAQGAGYKHDWDLFCRQQNSFLGTSYNIVAVVVSSVETFSQKAAENIIKYLLLKETLSLL